MSADAFGVEKRFFSAKARKKDAKKGDALKDGSFPIKDKADLANAERLEHFSKHPGAVKRLISRKKKEFDVSKSAFGVEHSGISKGSVKTGLKLVGKGRGNAHTFGSSRTAAPGGKKKTSDLAGRLKGSFKDPGGRNSDGD